MILRSILAIALTPITLVAIVPAPRGALVPTCQTLRIESDGKSMRKPFDNRVSTRREASDWACVVRINR